MTNKHFLRYSILLILFFIFTGYASETGKIPFSVQVRMPERNRYVLGPPMIPAQERFPAESTFNSPFELVYWQWAQTWGWDFPMTAMAATRLGMPDKAIDALFMNIETNSYLPNGHNYQNLRLPLYLPGNGALLTSLAMMCAGWDGAPDTYAPGFPKDGKWKVKWEGLKKIP